MGQQVGALLDQCLCQRRSAYDQGGRGEAAKIANYVHEFGDGVHGMVVVRAVLVVAAIEERSLRVPHRAEFNMAHASSIIRTRDASPYIPTGGRRRRVAPATGYAERDEALEMLRRLRRRGYDAKTLAGDKGYCLAISRRGSSTSASSRTSRFQTTYQLAGRHGVSSAAKATTTAK